MRQLTGEDARFVYADSGHANSNITLVSIYDPSTTPGGRVRYTEFLRHVEGRLHLAPIFRQKLLRVPLELDHPYWIEDERFDLEYHVRHVALPKPGDWRQFCIQASRIHARSLDMSRPLWELYLVEGLDAFLDLPKDSFAVLAKIHHAAIGVDAGADITTLLHDTTPDTPQSPPPEPWFPDAPPGALGLLWRAAYHNAIQPFMVAAPLTRAFGRVIPVVLGALGDAWRNPDRFPLTRFNAEVSPHRVFETRRFTIDEFKRIRGLVKGATINDVVLAVCGGALRRYLAAQDELPDASLIGVAPVSRRNGGDVAEPGYQVLRVPLGNELEDPVRRLRSIQQFTAAAKDIDLAVGAKELTDVTKHAPAATLAMSGRLLAATGLGLGQRAPLANCTITNVPGPSIPLYLNGARMSYFSAIMPIYDGMGLVFAVTSYDGRIIISPTSCREQMPDPEQFAACLRESFQEYLALASQPRRVRTKRQARPAAGKAAIRPRVARAGRRAPTSRRG
jgi:WS/DGAT/MGAT family acyltransferase